MILPVLGTPNERADAARNRRRILDAADRLFTRDGVSCTSMDAIASEAGVGKGTLFRRFGDRASLALALLESSEQAFQEAFLRGPAPLGPGAPASERVIAFGRARLQRFTSDGELILAAESAGAAGRRFGIGPYAAHHLHVSLLLAEVDETLDAVYVADVLLAPLSSELILHQMRSGMTLEQIADAWERLVRRILSAAG